MGAARDLTNAAPSAENGRIVEAFVADGPRVGLPTQRRAWGGFPDFLSSSGEAGMKQDRTDARSMEKDDANACKRASMRRARCAI